MAPKMNSLLPATKQSGACFLTQHSTSHVQSSLVGFVGCIAESRVLPVPLRLLHAHRHYSYQLVLPEFFFR